MNQTAAARPTATRLVAACFGTALCLPLMAQTPTSVPPVSIPDTHIAASATAPAASNDGRLTLNLKAADIGVLIETVSQMTGKSFIVDPRVEGRVTVISTAPQSAAEIYETFLSVLRVHGYAAVASGEMIKIVPDAIAMQDGSLGNGGGGADALVTRVVELKYVSATEMSQLLRPLAPQQATLSPHAGSNSLVISDRAGNVARLVSIIQRIDTVSDAEVEVIPLAHANAAELARTLTALADDKTAQVNAQAPRVFADTRTNSVLLAGAKNARLKLRALIAHLDTPLQNGGDTQVVYLRNASAKDLVPILQGVAATLTGDGSALAAERRGIRRLRRLIRSPRSRHMRPPTH
jgi:general secretion pathway protein D